MPKVFLSPSTQGQNEYITGGTEELYMNQLTDEIIPYLDSSGIGWARNDPDLTSADAIAAANAGAYGLYISLHTNTAPENQRGKLRGSDVYYDRYQARSRRAAEFFVQNLKLVYPLPDLVRIVPTSVRGEVTLTRAPSVLLELAYHDNFDDADWIRRSQPSIAWAIAKSITQYFGLPLYAPMEPLDAVVKLSSGTLNLRKTPDLRAPVLASMPNGAAVTVLGMASDWDVVRYGSQTGYAAARYLQMKG